MPHACAWSMYPAENRRVKSKPRVVLRRESPFIASLKVCLAIIGCGIPGGEDMWEKQPKAIRRYSSGKLPGVWGWCSGKTQISGNTAELTPRTLPRLRGPDTGEKSVSGPQIGCLQSTKKRSPKEEKQAFPHRASQRPTARNRHLACGPDPGRHFCRTVDDLKARLFLDLVFVLGLVSKDKPTRTKPQLKTNL